MYLAHFLIHKYIKQKKLGIFMYFLLSNLKCGRKDFFSKNLKNVMKKTNVE
jgi:hypothetical protein